MATTAAIAGAQFDALPYEEGRRWELLRGDLVEVSSPTAEHQEIVYRLLAGLKRYLEGRNGLAFQDVEFALSDRERVRPDVCVLLDDRALALDRRRIPIPGDPDIAAEVISSAERAGDTRRKLVAYLHADVREVWQIYPVTREVLIHAGEQSRELDESQSLTTDLLPGWILPVASLFQ